MASLTGHPGHGANQAPAPRVPAWPLLVATSTLYFLGGNEADNDLWIHLLIGRRMWSGWFPLRDDLSFTAAGAPWIDHEWLTHGILWGLWQLGGGPALWVAKLLAGAATALWLWRQTGRWSREAWVRGAVMVPVLSVLGRGFAVRPQVLTYAATAWLVGWLARRERAGARDGLLLFAVTCLWANAHGGFVVGLAVLGAWAVARRDAGAWKLLAAGAAAVLVNPYGWRLPAYVLRELGAAHPTTEWQPLDATDPSQWPFLLLLAATIVTLPRARLLRRHPWHGILLAGAALMAFRHQRHTPLVAVLAAAPLADQLDAYRHRLRERIRLSAPALRLLGAGVAAVALLQLSLTAARTAAAGGGLRFRAEEYPVGAVAFLQRHGVRGNVAVPLDWGSYLLWHAWPRVRVSLDGRFVTVYPRQEVLAVFDYFRGRSRVLLDRYPTDLVLAPRGSPHAAARDSRWRVVYRDEVAAVHARRDRALPAEAVVGRAARGWMPFP